MRWHVFLTILGCALVPFLPRVLPLMLFSRMELPEWGVRWLHYVPIAVMAALNIAHESLQARTELKQVGVDVGEELRKMNAKLEQALSRT